MPPKAGPSLPAKVKLGTYTYSIVTDKGAFDRIQVEERELLCGRQLTTTQQIHINPAMGPDCTRDTVIHECLHHFFSTSGLRGENGLEMAQEEQVVNMLGSNILAMLRDNPELVTYLTK